MHSGLLAGRVALITGSGSRRGIALVLLRAITASRWDEALSDDENLNLAGAPAAWPQLERQR